MALITFGKYADFLFRCQLQNDPDYRCATYVLGTQGAGKSTLLGHIAEQCAAAGEGVLVIDTQGELAEDITSRTTHPDKLIYVAPAAHLGSKRYWALNPLELDRRIPGASDRLVSNLRVLFDRMELANSERMPRIRNNLAMAARLIYALPDPTLPDLIRLFYDPALRARLYTSPNVSDHVKEHWQAFDHLTDRQRQEVTSTTLTRLEEFLTVDVVNRLVTPPHSTIRLPEWLDQGKLVVCNLGRAFNVDLGTEISKLLGNFVVAQLVAAAYTRPSINQEKRRIWRVIVDEFQELAGDQFAEIITKTRKYQVFPVLAHQNLSQLNDTLTNAVLSCHARFFLRTSAEDAGLVRRLFHDDEGYRLAHYPNFLARAHLPNPDGRTRFEVLKLQDWWADQSKSQLAQAIGRAEDDRFTLPEVWFAARRPSTVSASATGAPNGAPIQRTGLDAWERPDQAAQDHITVPAGSAQAAGVSAPADPAGRGNPEPHRPAHLLDYGPGG